MNNLDRFRRAVPVGITRCIGFLSQRLESSFIRSSKFPRAIVGVGSLQREFAGALYLGEPNVEDRFGRLWIASDLDVPVQAVASNARRVFDACQDLPPSPPTVVHRPSASPETSTIVLAFPVNSIADGRLFVSNDTTTPGQTSSSAPSPSTSRKMMAKESLDNLPRWMGHSARPRFVI